MNFEPDFIPFSVKSTSGSLGSLLGLIVKLGLMVVFFVHLEFCIAIFRDGKVLEGRQGRKTWPVARIWWAIATLIGGVFVAAVYWAIHHSTLNPTSRSSKEGSQGSAEKSF